MLLLIRRYPDIIKTVDKYKRVIKKPQFSNIQDKEFNLVKKIKGSYFNVVGLPLEDIKKYCF